jgi:hypothetical protein
MGDITRSNRFSTKVLLTKEATRSNVISEILRACDCLKAGDIFLVGYSCHGGQVPDRQKLTPSFQLTTFCLYDGQFPELEFYSLLSRFPKGVRILVLSDKCHSGTVTKVAFYRNPGRYRFMPPDVALSTYRANKNLYDKIAENPDLKKVPKAIKASVLQISSCQDNQLASDGDFNGIFTANLYKVWNNGKFKGNYKKFHKSLVMNMPPEQTPNYYWVGTPGRKFENQKPFTI